MLKQVLSSKANSSVKKYVAQYRLFCLYMKSRGLRLVLPCDSLLISEYLSNLHETKKIICCCLVCVLCVKMGP